MRARVQIPAPDQNRVQTEDVVCSGGHTEVTDFLGTRWRQFRPIGFENQRRCPRRCAADAQVRIVRRPVQNPKVCRLGQESRSTVRIRYNNSGLRGVVGAAPQGCGGPRCQAHDPRRGVIPNRRVSRKVGRSRRRRWRSSAAPNLLVNFIASCRRRSPAGPTYSARRRRATPRLSPQGR